MAAAAFGLIFRGVCDDSARAVSDDTTRDVEAAHTPHCTCRKCAKLGPVRGRMLSVKEDNGWVNKRYVEGKPVPENLACWRGDGIDMLVGAWEGGMKMWRSMRKAGVEEIEMVERSGTGGSGGTGVSGVGSQCEVCAREREHEELERIRTDSSGESGDSGASKRSRASSCTADVARLAALETIEEE